MPWRIRLPNDVKLQEGHPVDENLRPIKVGGKSTAIETAQHGIGARVNGDLEVTGNITGNVKDVELDLTKINSTDLTIDDSGDITLDAAGGDVNILQADLTIPSSKKVILGAVEEYIYGDGTDIHFGVGSGGDINIPSDIGLTFADDGEKIESNGTNLTISSGGNVRFISTGEIGCGSSTVGFTVQTGTDDTNIDWGEGNKYHLLLENNSTVTFATNPISPCNLLLKVAQGDGGSNTITWAVTSGTIYWAGGGILNADNPTLTTTDDKTDILSFYFDGTNYFGVASLNFDTT